MADQATPQQPIVILVNYGRYSDDIIDVSSTFTRLVYGASPRGFDVDLPAWYFSPEEEDFWEIVQERRDLSLEVVEKWIESEEFGTYVADQLLKEIRKKAEEGEDIDPEAVKVILLEDNILDLTKPVSDALATTFPNAVICDDEGEKVSYLYSMRLSELKLSNRVRNLLARNAGVGNVGQLVDMTETYLLAISEIGEKTIEEIKDALKEQGLALKQD